MRKYTCTTVRTDLSLPLTGTSKIEGRTNASGEETTTQMFDGANTMHDAGSRQL